MIDLYTFGTPNGRKVSIMLEALGVSYQVHEIDIHQGDQRTDEFTAISPNQKIPAIVDSDGPGGEPISIFETGAILIYLAEKYQKFLPMDVRKRTEVMEWLMWQMGGFGPFLGQAHHFLKFAKEDVPYGKDRYKKEAHRLWGVLDKRLQSREYVCDELSIADFAIYPWAARFEWHQVDRAEFPNVKQWMDRMERHEFVKKGMLIPSDR